MKTLRPSSLGRRASVLTASILALGGLVAAVYATQDTPSSLNLKHDEQSLVRSHTEPSSFSSIVKRVSPSVVKITVQTKARRIHSNADFPGMDDPFFRHFFGDEGK